MNRVRHGDAACPAVIDDDDFVALTRIVLSRERLQAGAQPLGPIVGRDNDRDLRGHAFRAGA
jgi:hypothetical protein